MKIFMALSVAVVVVSTVLPVHAAGFQPGAPLPDGIIIGGVHAYGTDGLRDVGGVDGTEYSALLSEEILAEPQRMGGQNMDLPGSIKDIYAALSQCSYSKKPCNLPPGWRKLTDWEKQRLGLDPALFDYRSGFHAEMFRNIDGSYVIGFEGTDSARDWTANLGQGLLPVVALQYSQAARLAKAAGKALGSSNLRFTGHSLGGGLASLAAILTGRRAVTFNAAGLNPATVSMQILPLLAGHDHSLKKIVDLGLNWQRRNELVTSYRVNGDELTTFQEKLKFTGSPMLVLLDLLTPDAVGRKINLENQPSFFKLDHGIDKVLSAPVR